MTKTRSARSNGYQPTESEWEALQSDVFCQTGLDLHHYKRDHMRNRILMMVESLALTSLNDLALFLSASPEYTRWFIDKLSINVSELYRDPAKWVELAEWILPRLIKRNPHLKCWSAGCSFGAEAHTLAIILDVHFRGEHTVLGTDIDEAALHQARRGEFTGTEMRHVESQVRSEYFDFDQDREVWKASDAIRRYLAFRRADLFTSRFGSDYDLILYRNVAIYLTESAQDHLYRKLFMALRPGGFLFTGNTENIVNAEEIGFENPMPMFYRRPMINDKRIELAS
jgi:chemotaxis protein methyltransferase CheR